MAKDKKQNSGDSQNQNRDQKTPKPQDIDVSSDSLEEKESDSDLDIQALLRKYMPDYDREEEPEEEEGGVLSRLKKSAELPADDPDEDWLEEPAAEMDLPDGEEDFDADFAALDAAFSDVLPEDAETKKDVREADDFDFTDDIPAQLEDDGVLEDEEGIYEEDDDRYSRAPRKQKADKPKKGLFSFGKKDKKRKAAAARTEGIEDLILPEDLEQEEELPTSLFLDEEADTGEMGNAVMNSMGLEEEADSSVLDMSAEEPAFRMAENTAAEEEASGNLSDEEMLKLAEELLGGRMTAASAEATEETAEEAVSLEPEEAEELADGESDAASEEEFDPTDINLMVAFGMDDGSDGKKKAGKTARQLGDRLEHEKVTREGKKVKLDRAEYVDRSQNADIEKGYHRKMIGLWIKLGLCGVFTLLLLLFENIEVIAKLFTGTAKQFGGVFDPAVYPVVYAMVSLQLMLLACLCAYEQIIKGFGYLFRGVPRPESMTSLLLCAGLLYTVVIARITVQSDEPVMFNFTVAVAAIMTLVGEIFNTKREMMNFRVISSANPKHIVCRVSDDQSRGEATAFSEEEEVCDVMRIEKTDFIDGFYNRLYTPDGTTNVFMSCAMGVMVAAAVLFGIFASVRGGSPVEIARVVCVTLMTVAPLSVYLSLNYPFYRANVAASEYDSAIIGETSLAEYSNASIVTFDDKNVFPSYSVKVQNIRIFNNARIDRVLYYASSVFSKAGGPLQDVFEIATLEMGHSDDVQIFDTENGFLAAEVDGVNIIFGSGAALAKKGFKIRKQELEDDVDLSDELSIMYMFREDKLVAKMYIQYVMDGDIELILSQFQNSGLYVCVRTFDPNIDERMIARKIKMKRMPLKVIRYNGTEEVTAYSEKVDSGLVTSGSPKSLLQIISYCDKVLHTKKTNIALAILAILVGAAVMLLLVLSGSIGIMNSLYIILYQLLWLVPMLLSTKMFIR